MNKYSLSFFILIASVNALAQDQPEPEKPGPRYTLFNPVPRNKMREMATDRPDVTENAYTVDAGHLQVEADAFKQVRSKQGNAVYKQNFYNLANLKLGITDNTDLQFVINTYNQSFMETAPGATASAFFNDMTFRIKYNLWGNSGGNTALSIMPFINIPLKNNAGVDGGIIFPFAAGLPNGWDIGAQAQFNLVKNENNRQYHAEILNSVTFSRELVKNLEGYAELFDNYDFLKKQLSLYADGGLIYSLSANFKLDTGLNYGITKGSDNIWFVGFSFRY